MRKKVFGAKLSRERASREALFVSLVENLILKGSIKTTKPKAKAIVGMVDKLVVLSKKDTLSSKRQILKKLRGNKVVATQLWGNIAKTFSERSSGFTRIIPLQQRKGDMAQMVKMEWSDPIQAKSTTSIASKKSITGKKEGKKKTSKPSNQVTKSTK